MAPQFVPGLELSRDFYATEVRPLLRAEFPGLDHAAALLGPALLGPGSDVAGYDTERSTDHDWGPRLQVLLNDADRDPVGSDPGDRAADVTAMLAARLGTAFARLPGGGRLAASLTAAITADPFAARERHLTGALTAAAQLHNQLGLTPPLDTGTGQFFSRPFQVLGAGRFADALRAAVTDPPVRRLPPYGAADQFIDSTDAAGDRGFLRACAAAGIRPASAE